MFFCFMKI